jgi:hypothetical protein
MTKFIQRVMHSWNYRWLVLSAVAVMMFSVFNISGIAHASPVVGFNPARIIDNGVFTNSNSMNAAQIQAFLNSKVPTCDTNGTGIYPGYQDYSGETAAQWGSAHGFPAPFICLKSYTENGLSAAQIIYNTAQKYQINPQVLVVLLQKEQGLVTDTWPLPTQYRTATGYGCPDTTTCDTQYFGLTNQLNWSGKMFRAIIDNNPNWYTPYVLGSNFIKWNPNSNCGGTNVSIVNSATQALYNYTPYQPNQASLNAGYGLGDSCSSYGNRNFFLYFTDWFGPTLSDVNLQMSSSSNTVYVVYDGKKQGIPSQDVLSAWGLDHLPIYTVSDVALGAIPDGGTLTRLVKNPYNPAMLLLADNGGFFSAWPNTITNFGIDPTTASTITPSLLSMTSRSSNLSPFIQTQSVGGVLLVDKGTYHSFSSPDTLIDWAGNTPTISTISSSLFSNLIANASYGIYSGQITDTLGNRYLMNGGLTAALIGSLKINYPQDKQLVVNPSLISILPTTSALTPFVESPNSPAIYLIDSGKKLGFTNPVAFNSFITSNHLGTITYLSQSVIDSIISGSAISSQFIYNMTIPANNYHLGSTAIPLPSSFAANTYGLGLSTDTINDFNASTSVLSCGDGTGFIKSPGSATIYMVENGKKRAITNPRDFGLLDTSGALCELPQNDINTIPDGQIITPFVQYSGSYYLLENGKRYLTDVPSLANLSVLTTTAISSQIFNAYADGGTLSLSFTTSGGYYFVSSGSYYSTDNPAVAQVWNIGNQTHTKLLLQGLSNGGSLDKYARSSDTANGTIYLIDGGLFHGIPDINSFVDSGGLGKNTVTINANYIAAHTGAIWQSYLAKDSTGTIWVLDAGVKRKISSVAQADWIGSQTVPILSDSYLSLLAQGTDLTYSIATNSSYTIYGLDTGTKRGIPTLNKYIGTKYDPDSIVSSYLLNSILTGPIL